MDYRREYNRFVSSYYFGEGLRITAGVTLPAITFNLLGHLDIGMVLSLGAMCVSASDIPGPIQLRRNGMLACIGIVSAVALITGFLSGSAWLMGSMIAIFCFLFSMFGVYGARANSIGVAALLIMVLSIFRLSNPGSPWWNAVYVAVGGAWYMLMSLIVYSFRPFRLIQQALGESITAVAGYLRTRSHFYLQGVDYDAVYKDVIERQGDVQKKQLLVRELMYRSRHITKESSNTSRTLLMMFTDTVDLFERSTTSFYSYDILHRRFDQTGILRKFSEMIAALADALDELGVAVQAGRASRSTENLKEKLAILQQDFEKFISEVRSQENLEPLMSLRKILQSIEDILARIETLHRYSTYHPDHSKAFKPLENYGSYIEITDLRPSLFVANLTISSSVFRHSLRVSLATLTGFIISHFVSFGHSYWILLTIIVILKPAYSITRSRNLERVTGTVAGALIGLAILYLVEDRSMLFTIMIILMAGSYSFMRTRYLVSVIFMTPYVLILFYLLGSDDFQLVLKDRLIDTMIGSAIAFLASLLLVPAWEKQQILHHVQDAIGRSADYLEKVSRQLIPDEVPVGYKLARKHAFVSLGNLSDAFSRMLNEPRSKQPSGPLVHQLVVLTHNLNSHIASIAQFGSTMDETYRTREFTDLLDFSMHQLRDAEAVLRNDPGSGGVSLRQSRLPEKMEKLLAARWEELEQGLFDTETRNRLSQLKPIVDQLLFISNISADINGICRKLVQQQ